MDPGSAGTVAFLTALQDCTQQLRQLRNDYLTAGASRVDLVFNLSGRPFHVHEGASKTEYDGCIALGLIVRTAARREYDLGIDLLWTGQTWRIETSAWTDEDDGGQTRLRELPAREAADLASCLQQLHAAVADLAGFKPLVFAP